jgi:hypothetical protein
MYFLLLNKMNFPFPFSKISLPFAIKPPISRTQSKQLAISGQRPRKRLYLSSKATTVYRKNHSPTTMEQCILDTDAGKQLS